MKRYVSAVLAAFLAVSLGASPARIVRSINDGWLFTKEGQSEKVNIPHTWNAHDTWDETPGFYRGLCTYEKKIIINDNLEGRKVYVRFEGSYQVTELIVNGQAVGRHIGGYTAFIFDVTTAVRQGENNFLIKVDNSHNADIPPLSADFTFYGGIYRDVELVITRAEHISNTHYASSGVFITTPVVGPDSKVCVRTFLDVKPTARYSLKQEIYAPDGSLVAENTALVRPAMTLKAAQPVKKGVTITPARPVTPGIISQTITVRNPLLWDIDSPNLYRVVTTLCDAKGGILDSVENPLGFRTFSFDADKGFILNGRSVKLIGTNRHQDYLDRGNALADEMHVRDVKLLKDMGGNFLRISHYPQDPIVTQTCDRLGIVSSVEIPVVNAVTESEAFKNNCIEMAREMVCQDFNSPSVLIWAYMNEVLLRVPYKKKTQPQEYEAYLETVTQYAKAINEAIKLIDPDRPTMIPCHGKPELYASKGLGRVPDIIGFNYYNGWYSKKCEDFDKACAKIHEIYPDKPFILTEYGAGIDPRLHSRSPERRDFSMEYGLYFHRYYYNKIAVTPYICGSNAWNLNDFYAEPRIDAVPHVNNKGLVGLDRTPKDTYFYYQAHLLKRPFIAIGGRGWKLRGGNEGEQQTVEVYTNTTDPVTLYHNGVKVATAKVEDATARFTITSTDGENTLRATAGKSLCDYITYNYAAVPKDMTKFTEMNVLVGSNLYFEDAIQGAAWIPDQPYTPGSWGYVGGDIFRRCKGSTILLGTDEDIKGTVNNPVFQTQRVNIGSFKADVPDGKYYVYLYFAELAVNSQGKALPYNIGDDDTRITQTERVFNVSINGTQVLSNYDIKAEEGPLQAAIRKFTVDVAGGRGLSVDFGAVKGAPVLNAIRIYRCM